MFRRTSFVGSLAVTLALAGQALAATPATTLRSSLSSLVLGGDQVVPVAGQRLVGVTWTAGSPTVRYRWHSATGWGAWETAEADTAEAPEGRPGTEPLWRPTGADSVQVRTTGATRGLHLLRVADKVVHSLGLTQASAETGRALLGTVHSRAEWGADESMRKKPEYVSTVKAVVVHHTVNSNGYSPNEVPSLIRADYTYHVQGRGWDDLGYNLLVDQFGRVWEGRYGGLGKATVGAHAQGFNDYTLGVAMIGDMTKTTASPEAERALARVVAYAAGTWHWDPTSSVSLVSDGSPRYGRGRRVTLPRVFGHQQTGQTACPGSLQDRLADLRLAAAAASGPAPRIVDAVLSGAPLHAPSPAVLDARLTRPASWRVDITDPDGTALVTSTTGRGTAPHLAWDGLSGGLPVLPGTYTWTIKAGDGFHETVKLQGRFDVGLPLVPLDLP